MKTLVFDTETSGLFSNSKPDCHPDQPHICQLAALLIDDGEEIAQLYCYIRPSGWVIEEGAFRAHGITVADCEQKGISAAFALLVFSQLYEQCDEVVGFNVSFDMRMIAAEEVRYNMILQLDKPEVCVMKAATPVCKLPYKNGYRNGSNYKWPKLKEAYEFFFKKPLDDAHDSMADVRATWEIYKLMKEQNLI